MTDEDALRLCEGDRVERQLKAGDVTVVVVRARVLCGKVRVLVRRDGINPQTERRYGLSDAPAGSLRRLLVHDCASTVLPIYADWLEEQGYLEAAAGLRKTFLEGGVEVFLNGLLKDRCAPAAPSP